MKRGMQNAECGVEIPGVRFCAVDPALRASQSALAFRVAHVLRKFNPAEWGGTETAIQRLTAGLGEQGVGSIVYCPGLNDVSGEPLAGDGCAVKRFQAFLPILGISPEQRRQMIAVGGNLMSFDLPLALWREPDITLIHAHTLGRLGGIAAAVARARRLPLVVTIHGGYLDLPPALKNSFTRAAQAGLEWGKIFGLLLQSRRMLARADAILTCNPNEARLLREEFPGKRIQVQPHGIPVALEEQDGRAAAREAFPQIRDRQVLLAVGRIDPVKNQGWLVAQALTIFRKHPRAILVFAGACTDEIYGNRLRKQVREFNLEKKILLTGGLPPGDPRLIGLFQEAQAVVLPSISETFGLVLLEAWAAGTTVISSRTSGATALVKHGENGWLFDLEDAATFHAAVDATLANPSLGKQLAMAGKTLAAGYSLSAVAGRVKDLYVELIEERHALRYSARR
ncbi:MAG TPA: glycosyltransferase family 4 protein [Verrucomicrobiae bacterium]|nr:glycosyltransferase family 4 protein [Verrucomicrobiae bacterium]